MKMIDPKNLKDRLAQELIDNIPDVIYFKDLDGRLILVNKAHAEGLGLKPEDVVGKTDYDFFPKDQADKMTADDRQVISTGQPIIDRIEKTTQPNGSRHCVSTTKLPRYDEKGNIVGIMGITRDITERTALEEKRASERERVAEQFKGLKDKLEIEKNKLEEILSIEEDLNSIVKLEHLVKFIVEKTTKILEAEKCSLMLFDNNMRRLTIKGHKGIDQKNLVSSSFIGGNTVANTIANMGLPILVQDIEKDSRFKRKNRLSYRSKSFLSVPIKSENHIIGILNVADKRSNGGDVFNETDLKILKTLSQQISIALDNARLYKELNYLTISDPLTNMYNYRYFAKSLDEEIKRVKRYSEDLCLFMIDVDNFKSYNDTFGHLEGDSLLKKVSRTLSDNIREVDIACRYAGDEFVVILPKTSLEDALVVAEKIKRKVEDCRARREITLSIGVAKWRSNMDRHDLVLKADKALYEAKRGGKNKVCLYKEKPLDSG